MPRTALYKPELAEYAGKIVGELSLEQAGIRTGLSGETVRRLKSGKVPEPQTLRAFAEGFADRGADLTELMVICGYEQPADVLERVCLALRGDTTIPEEGKRQVLDFVRELQGRGGKGK